MASKSFFKTLTAYRLNVPVTVAQVEEALSAKRFSPCGPQDSQSVGFIPPRGGEHDPMLYANNGQILVALQVQSKILPGSVIREFADERAKEIFEREGRRVGRKEMKELKEAIQQELLPKAFTKSSVTQAWINSRDGFVVVNATGAKADLMITKLIDTMDFLKVKSLKLQSAPAAIMAAWLSSGEVPAGFTVDQDCELKSSEAAAIRYVRHALDGDDVREHLAAGKVPTRLAMTWNDRISFVLTERMTLKAITPLDVMVDQATEGKEAEEIFESEFALMTGEYSRLLKDLIDVLGGEVPSE